MRQDFVFARQRRCRNLRDHEARIEAWMVRKKRRQVPILRIQQTFDPPFRNVGQYGERHRHEVESKSQRLAVEIAAGENVTGILAGEYEGIVRGAVQLDCHDAPYVLHAFAYCTVDLRYASEAIRILNPAAIDVRLTNFTFTQEER